MSDEISRVIEQDAKRVGRSIADGAGRAIHKVLKETEERITQSVRAHEVHDRNAASDLEKAARRRDETPSTHTGGPDGAAPVSGTGTGAVHRTPTVAGAKADAQGNLHDQRGRFTGKPKDGTFVSEATPGASTKRQISDTGKADFDRTRAERSAAKSDKASAGKQLDDLADTYGVPAAQLRAKRNDAALLQLRRNGASRAEVRAAETAATDYRRADADLHARSERLGMQAGEDILRQDGYRQISGSSSRAGRPGEADLIGVSPDGQSVKVIEAKGGGAGLGDGRHLPDHVPPGQAQQGSPAYLNDLLKRDPEFQQALQTNPALRQAYESGTLKIDYTLVSATAAGNVTERPLVRS